MSNDPDGFEDGDLEDSSDEEVAAAAATKKSSKKRRADGGDGSSSQRKKTKGFSSMIDDAAEESGDEGGGDDDEDDEDDDENNNDYVKDGFVVDEDEEEEDIRPMRRKKRSGDLEDSDDDDDDDDDDIDEGRSKKFKKVRKMRNFDRLDEDDLDLVREARGEERPRASALAREREMERRKIVANNESELRKGLFLEEAAEEDEIRPEPSRKHARGRMVERYDEDGMDDFIDDDIGDQGVILASERRTAYDDEAGGEVNEAQMQEASDIFGTDYLDYMATEGRGDDDADDLFGKDKYRERGVGVDLGVDSDDDISVEDDEDEDDLFDDDDDDGGVAAHQRHEATKLKRQKRELARQERRRKAQEKRNALRKAQLRRAFEPVQLIENFCTDRDDEIRRLDAPERFFDWNTPFHGASTMEAEITADEEEESLWMVSRIPDIAAEYYTANPDEPIEAVEQRRQAILHSIIFALRYMHLQKLEPAFIKRYRKDVVTSTAVQDNLYNILDEDTEWDGLLTARNKVESLIHGHSAMAQKFEAMGVASQDVVQLEQQLNMARTELADNAAQESKLKDELAAINQQLGSDANDEEDDDDDGLFADDDDNDDDEEKKRLKKQKEGVKSHLQTVQLLMGNRAENVAGLERRFTEAQSKQQETQTSQGPAMRIIKKARREQLLNADDMEEYLQGLTDPRNIVDISSYMSLVREGSDAIIKKEMPGASTEDKSKDDRKRSRRFDRDFYRTCVSEGLRDISYRFLLSPSRTGIKLEDQMTMGQFNYSRKMPGEKDASPMRWNPPVMDKETPDEFANELIGSGDLVLLSSNNAAKQADGLGMETKSGQQDSEDKLRGCRYVAAMELAYEPRIRRQLRAIYRRHAVLSTRPTKKGKENIDCFHDYYGLHLIRSKPVSDHFPMEESDLQAKLSAATSSEERAEIYNECKGLEKNSCLQFLNLLKAEQTADLTISVHLPMARPHDKWYDDTDMFKNRENQDISLLLTPLERVYLPLDVDMMEWNEERLKVLKQAIFIFLLPQFEAEVRKELREAAVKAGVREASHKLHEMAMEGPYRPHAIAHAENRFLYPTENLKMVGICCASDSKDATYMASVTERGEFHDHLAIPSGTSVDKPKMREKVISFLLSSRPAAIVIGTSGGFDSRFLVRKMTDLANEAMQRWSSRHIQGEDEDEEEFNTRREALMQYMPSNHYDDGDEDLDWKCNVDLIDDSVAQLFGRSVRGKKEFADHAVNLKCAIAIARHAKDPLSELAYTWSVASDTGNFGAEMLYLNIHPLQKLLPKTYLLRSYERVLCEVVAEIGVDVNTACALDHSHGLLTFVPGMGPRKASNLKQNIVQQGGTVSNRRALLEQRYMGPVVYNNSVAFLRIRDTEELRDQFLHPLDDTRLHPDVYHRNNWAIKIAIDALERSEDESRNNKENANIKALKDVMDNSGGEVRRLFDATKAEWESLYGNTFMVADWNPNNVPTDRWGDKVEELDLETFARMIEESGMGKWHSHLQMIKWEFRLPFVDPRTPMQRLVGDKLFHLITGETDQSLRPGKEVTGKVLRNGDFGSRVKLEGDIPAFIPLRNLADEHVESAEDVVTVAQVVTAIITEVKKEHMCVDMSLKLEDFRKPQSSWERPASLQPVDRCFDERAAMDIETKKNKDREARLEAMHLRVSTKLGEDDGETKKKIGRVSRRACAHPAFRNANNAAVEKELKDAGAAMVGEALIRPSSKSSDSLAIHWAVREGSIKVVEVLEEEKDTEASIGKKLKIKDEVYESIDELLGRYIAPMNDYVEEMTSHRKFADMTEDDLDEKLKREKKANPSGVFYNLCWTEMHPGYASLRFILSSNARHHIIGISPNGFMWGQKTYPGLDNLLNDFKKNPRGNPANKRAPPPSGSKPAPPPKPSRWGNRPPPPSAPPAWRQQPAPPARPPPPAGTPNGWGGQAGPAVAQWDRSGGGGGDGSGMQPAPPSYRPPAPTQPPPPPAYGRPPPPGPPPTYQQYSQQPPPPPPGAYQHRM